MAYGLIFTALADPTRRAIFEDLRAGPLAVARLAERHPVSRPAVSQHLKVLERAGLVRAVPRGASRHYAVASDGLGPLRDYLETVWGDALLAFANEVQNQQEKPNG